ncbi:hypothetical protein LPJ59_001903 [Coemansia sp. RSA 2399]|nr:hypothetical protein LPJ59_001903 [Coemansia sp. RSA 2399]
MHDGSSSSSHDGYGAFPSITWPLNRTEAGISHTGLDALSLGVLGGMLPAVGHDSRGPHVSWNPLSKPGSRQSGGLLREPNEPVVVRPPTRIPGFLQRSRTLTQQEMLRQMRAVHRELDIPPEVILDALQEASVDTMRESTSPFTGNVVACCQPIIDDSALSHLTGVNSTTVEAQRIALRDKVDVKPGLSIGKRGIDEAHGYRWSSNHKWVIYPGGECNSELWAMPLRVEAKASHAQNKDSPMADNLEAKPAMEFTTAIRQVSARESHPGFACVRTDSMAALVRVTQVCDATARNSRVHAEVVGDPYSYDRGDMWTTHVSWSPWNIPELALASGTGAVRLWDCSLGQQTELKTSDDMGLYGLQWNCCEYWNSPRHLLCANPDKAYYLDCRAGKSSLTPLLSLEKSEFAVADERFTAAQPSALHPMQAIVASTHLLRVFDQRYPGKPVIAWSMPHMQSAPPVYLHSTLLSNYEDGKAAAIFATAKASSQTYSFVYGQRDHDSPYISLEQGMLKSATSLSTVRESIQDPLAIDSQEHNEMISACRFSGGYPTVPLAGFALSLVAPRVSRKKNGTLSMASLPEVVCISVDGLGKVVGRRLSIAPSADAASPSNIVTAVSSRWTDFKISDGALTDGMGLVLQSKESRDKYLDNAWAEIRKRALAYQRVDMQDIYRYLVAGDVVHAETRSKAATDEIMSLGSLADGLVRVLPAIARNRKTAFELVSEILAGLPAQTPRASTQLPSWSVAGTTLRRELLWLKEKGREGDLTRRDPSGLARHIRNASAKYKVTKGPSRPPACMRPAWNAIKTFFATKKNTLDYEYHSRVAEDLVLSRIGIDAASVPEHPQKSTDPSAVVTQQKRKRKREDATLLSEYTSTRLDLDAKVAALAGAAGALRDAWDSGSLSIGIASDRRAPTHPESAWSVRSQGGKQKKPPGSNSETSVALEAHALQATQTEPIGDSRNAGVSSADVMAVSPPLYVPTLSIGFSQAAFQPWHEKKKQQLERSAAPGQKGAKKKARRTGF